MTSREEGKKGGFGFSSWSDVASWCSQRLRASYQKSNVFTYHAVLQRDGFLKKVIDSMRLVRGQTYLFDFLVTSPYIRRKPEHFLFLKLP